MTARILENVVETVEETVIEETKAETFRRLANKRVTNALDKIRLIGNLANRGTYEYTDDQVDMIEQVLVRALNQTMGELRHVKKNKPTFTL